MKKEIKLIYRATLTRYNFGEAYAIISKDFDLMPSNGLILEFLDDANIADPTSKDFETTIEINPIYMVVNVKN